MAIRVLDILNFSNSKNPQADSGLRLQTELLLAILAKRPDFFFYLVVPQSLLSVLEPTFRGWNVQLIPADLLPCQQAGGFHFNVREFSNLLDLRSVDVDVLFVNQPELTAPLLNFFNKSHFFDVHSFGYIHWMDWKRDGHLRNRWNVPRNLSLLTSILLSAVTGCNSRFGKEKILREAARWFHPEIVEDMDRKLVPLWPGIDSQEILEARTGERFPVKTIIFPFRAQTYTGFKTLIDHLARLWRKRQDFRLLLTDPSNYQYVQRHLREYPFLEIDRFNRREYLRALWMSDIVAGCHHGFNQWSLAMMEAVAADCIPCANRSSFFPEMLLEPLPAREHKAVAGRYFYYHGSLGQRLELLLDNLDEERERARFLGRQVREFYDWKNRVEDWIRGFELADAAASEISERSRAIRKIETLLREQNLCTKSEILEHLGWHPKSRHVSWTKYRKYLRRHMFEDSRSPLATFAVPAPGTAVGAVGGEVDNGQAIW